MLQIIRKIRIQSWVPRTAVNVRWFSDDDEKYEKKPKVKNEESKEKTDKKAKNQESLKKLNALIGSMPIRKDEVKVQVPKKKEKTLEPPTAKKTQEDKNIDDEKKPKVINEESKEKTDKKAKNQESLNKLNALLGSMPIVSKDEVKVQRPKKKKNVESQPSKSMETQEDKIISATEKIAEKIGGDVKQTQSELLAKLLGTGSLKKTESMNDLLGSLKVEVNKEKPKGMIYERDSDSKRTGYREQDRRGSYSRAETVRQALGSRRERNFIPRKDVASPSGSVQLFGSKPLGLFDGVSKVKDPLTTWSKLEQRELKLAITHPPSNYFEKMIMWTEQGRLWKFPIDNEQGWEEEQNVDFSEHVLLEMHLDGWCPTSGPVRHFMELVCVGLSKNHFLSAKEKKDHIFWYRDYFEEKKDLLGELMIMGKTPQPQLEA